ncbi:Hypothetical protein bglu_2g05270 [Burkholderia glumae BGR1]|uniref:hypothetical protein n=1 Tax=Burkholderia glumae TaxID=337 RepID=UPI0001A4A706|nr:Hypothetical protein bglu_2g05270 [Burkholderia glumae BGR1]
MHARVDRFRATPIGTPLEAVIDLPERYPEHAVPSRVGMAAIAAVAGEIAGGRPETRTDAAVRPRRAALVADAARVPARGHGGGRRLGRGAVFGARQAPPLPSVSDVRGAKRARPALAEPAAETGAGLAASLPLHSPARRSA